MRISIDEDTGVITAAPGVRETLRQVVFRRGDTKSVEVQFYRGADIISRPAGSTGKFSLKEKGKYSDAAMVEALSWTKVENDGLPYYRFNPNFSGSGLTSLLAASSTGYVDLMLEIEWLDGENVSSSVPDGNAEVTGRVWNDVNKADTDPPDPGPDPYPTSEKLIIHYDGITGWTGADSLEEIPTTAMPTGRLIAFVISGKTKFAKLIAGTNATSVAGNPIYVKPDDHALTTNERVWVSYESADDIPLLIETDLTGLMGGEATHLDSVSTTGLTEGQLIEIAGGDVPQRYRLEEKEYSYIDILSVSAEKVFTAGDLPLIDSVVEFRTAGTLPPELDPEVFYYVVDNDEGDGSFKVSENHGGTAISLTGPGTGAHEFFVHDDPWWVYPRDHDDSGMAWKLVGPETILSFHVVENGTAVIDGEHYAGFAPVSLLPLRIQFDLAANGGSDVELNVAADGLDLIDAALEFDTRTLSTDDAEVAVQNRLFISDEIRVTSDSSGEIRGLNVHIAGIAAPILGPSIGHRTQETAGTSLIANAGINQSVTEGATVTLLSTGSTPATGNVSYLWEQVSGPAVTIINPTAASPTFTAPPVAEEEEIVISLTVSDSVTLEEVSDTVMVTVGNITLVAYAGVDQSVYSGATVTLRSTGSTALLANVIAYEWEQIWGPVVALSSAVVASPTFTAPEDSRAYTFRLHVRNVATGDTVSDDVVIEIQNPDELFTLAIDEVPTCSDNADDRAVVGCENGIIYTSDDLLEWFKIDTGVALDINGIANRIDGRAVFVTNNGIYYSRNGITWTEALAQYSGRDWNAVCDSGSRFLAVSNDGRFARSDDGVTWTVGDLYAAGTASYQGVATDGSTKFLAMSLSGYLSYSTNSGASFTGGSPGLNFHDAAYSSTLDVWAVCGVSALRSFPDANFGSGIAANLSTNAGGSDTWYGVDWDPINEVFLATGFGVAKKSYDGLTWTDCYVDAGSFGTSTKIANLLGRFVVPSETLQSIVVTPEFPA